MPANHDYRCDECKTLAFDQLQKPTECEVCKGVSFSVYFGDWGRVNIGNNGCALNSREDSKGFVQRFETRDDPLAKIELGLKADAGLKTFSPEQTAHYQRKLTRDGDSADLRREILKQRQANNVAAGAPAKDAAWD